MQSERRVRADTSPISSGRWASPPVGTASRRKISSLISVQSGMVRDRLTALDIIVERLMRDGQGTKDFDKR